MCCVVAHSRSMCQWWHWSWHPEFENGFKMTGWENLDCIDLAQGRNQLWAVVNTVVTLWIP